jgi:hypothetical protein
LKSHVNIISRTITRKLENRERVMVDW